MTKRRIRASRNRREKMDGRRFSPGQHEKVKKLFQTSKGRQLPGLDRRRRRSHVGSPQHPSQHERVLDRETVPVVVEINPRFLSA